tara:strand:+ start:208178 stop:209101 length:924 start_codon:yes stop_codon:yes gene_type:complete
LSLILLRSDKNYEQWLNAFADFDPDFPVFIPETAENKGDIIMALSWKAPTGSYTQYPNLKVIGSMGAGVDHLFEDPELPENIQLTRVVDEYLATDMREFVLAQCMSTIKNLNTFSRKQPHWDRLPYRRVADVTVGIMGLGVLGQAVGKLLHQVGFKVTGWSHSYKDLEFVKSYSGEKELNKFLSSAEILVCLLPLTEETKGILNKALFFELPHGAYLINVARGGHLHESDLLDALHSGKLGGASLDVFEQEPLPKDHPFWREPNIFITPHVASVSSPASIIPQVVENYNRLQAGEPLLNTVSRKRGY